MKKVSLLIFALATTLFANAQNKLEEIWTTKETIKVPESVLLIPAEKTLYVSQIDGAGNAKDGIGGIAKLNLDGSIQDQNWVTGLNAPKGLGIYKNKLYVADLDVVVVIDTKTGKILNKVEVPDAVFLNDITVNNKGVVFVSDTRKNLVHKIENNKSEVYLENVTSANGLKFIGKDLYILAGPELWKVNDKKEITKIATGFEKGGDGIEPVGNGDFIVTCWAGIIYYVKSDGNFHKLLDVQGKMNTADLGFDEKKKIVYIPTFNNNSVIAYQLK